MDRIDFTWVCSRRKTASIEIADDLSVIVRTPYGISRDAVERFVRDNKSWIQEHRARKAARLAAHPEPSAQKIAEMRNLAAKILPGKVAFYARIMGVSPTGLRITSARKRFGSCSGKNSLCFSLYLMDYPDSAIDYVVVHELAHIRHKNHSRQFYEEIAKILPDYKNREKLLRQ